MSDLRNKEQHQALAPTLQGREKSRVSGAKIGSDDWYDQGFDLDAPQPSPKLMHDDGFGVNPALLEDASAQISEASKNRLRTDAEEQLQDGSVQITMDPLSSVKEISTGTQQLSAREGEIAVGGNGRIFDRLNGQHAHVESEYLGPKVKSSLEQEIESGSIYSPEYLAKKEQEEAAAGDAQSYLTDELNSDYRTLVHHDKNYTGEDSRFMQSLRERQEDVDAENQGAQFGLNARERDALASDLKDHALSTEELIKASTYKGPRSGVLNSNLQSPSDYLGPKPKPAEVKQVGTVYSPEYLAQKEKEEAEAAAAAREREMLAAAENGDYRTVVHHDKNYTSDDSHFMQSLRERQEDADAENQGAQFGLNARERNALASDLKEHSLSTEELIKASTYKGPHKGMLSSNLQAPSDYLGPKPKPAEVKQVGTVYSPEYLAKKEKEAAEAAAAAREREMLAAAENGDYRTVVRHDKNYTSDDSRFMQSLRERQEGEEAENQGAQFGLNAHERSALSSALSSALDHTMSTEELIKASTYKGPHKGMLRSNLQAPSDYLGPKPKSTDLGPIGSIYSDNYLKQKQKEAQASALAAAQKAAERASLEHARQFDMSDADIASMQEREVQAQGKAIAANLHGAQDTDFGGEGSLLSRRMNSIAASDYLGARKTNSGSYPTESIFNDTSSAEGAGSGGGAGTGGAGAESGRTGGSGDEFMDPAWWGEDIDFGGEGSLFARRLRAMSSSDYLGKAPAKGQAMGNIYSPEYDGQNNDTAAELQQWEQEDPAYRTRVERPDGLSAEDSRYLQSLRQAQSKQENADKATSTQSLATSGNSSLLESERSSAGAAGAAPSRMQQLSKARAQRASIERQQAIAAQQEHLRQMRQRQLQEQQERQRQALQNSKLQQAERIKGVSSSPSNQGGSTQEISGVAAAEARAAAQTMSYSEAIKDEYTTKGALELRKMREQELAQSPHGAKPKSNSEKTLEELAREYPGLSPEHLVKLKRSSNRCHLVSRTPIFDANSNISMYELKFTAGKVFQVNALKSDHVYHVLFGYFIRRGISCFIGRNKSALVMMPITYDFLDYIDRYSVNRVVLRICPEQPVTPSALHILTKLRRAGMSFAIDLMVLLKRDWNKAVLSIEYVMIDMSSKVREQLSVFQRLKIKAPWLKTIGYNDVNGDGYAYLAKRMIDFLDAPFWNVSLKLNQDPDSFIPLQQEVMTLVHELFKEQPNYAIFQQFLRAHEGLSRDMAVFLYRFRHASPRQVQNITELFHFLLDYSPGRSFSVMAGRTIMLAYVKAVSISSQSVLQEHYSQAIIRGYFVEYISKIFDDPFVTRYAFPCGMFSLLHLFLLKEEVDVIADDQYSDIFDRIYGESELMADIIECVQAIEATNLNAIFDFIHKYNVPPASVLISYEKALMRTNELLLVLNIVASPK